MALSAGTLEVGQTFSASVVEDLKRKSYVWHVMFTESEVCAPEFMDRYIDACRSAAPLHKFLARALDAEW